LALAGALVLPPSALIIAQQLGAGNARPQGPCDVYAAAQTPCVAAHSSTRALFAAYNGPLYQVMRQTDGKTLDIGVVPPNAADGGGYADAAAQDAFCANTYCWITKLYDQSGQQIAVLDHQHALPRDAEPSGGHQAGESAAEHDHIPAPRSQPLLGGDRAQRGHQLPRRKPGSMSNGLSSGVFRSTVPIA